MTFAAIPKVGSLVEIVEVGDDQSKVPGLVVGDRFIVVDEKRQKPPRPDELMVRFRCDEKGESAPFAGNNEDWLSVYATKQLEGEAVPTYYLAVVKLAIVLPTPCLSCNEIELCQCSRVRHGDQLELMGSAISELLGRAVR